ncbi:outer membrane beta-barrel protein [Pedobacter sp. N36a]|nr:outer membrane beta-barrel protein [Pedobacter sp. N36a]
MIVSNLAFSQKTDSCISGIVRHKVSKKILPGAIVTIETLDGVPLDKMKTDTIGVFKSKKIQFGTYVIKVAFIGFKDQTDTIILKSNQQDINIGLEESAYGLNTVNITAQKETPFLTFSKGKITLNVQNSSLSAGSTAYDVILRAPGMSEQNERLSFRAKTIAVLINGRPSNLTGTDLKNYLNALTSNQIEKVEIIPNPSAKYDSDGGVVINIILKKNDKNGLSGSLGLTLGSGKFFKGNKGLNLNYGESKMNTYLSYDFMRSKMYYEDYSKSTFNNSSSVIQNEYAIRKRNIHTLRVGIDYNLNSRLKIGGQFRTLINNGNGDRDNISENLQNNLSLSTANVKTISASTLSNPYLNSFLELTIDSLGKKLNINVDVFQQSKMWNDEIKIVDNLSKIGKIRSTQPTKVFTQIYSIDYVQPLVNGKLESGLKLQQTINKNNPVWENNINEEWQIDQIRTYRFLFKENIYSAYLNWNTTLLNKVDMNFGTRIENTILESNLLSQDLKNRRSFFYLFPSLGLEYV